MTLILNQSEPESDNISKLWGSISLNSGRCFTFDEFVRDSASISSAFDISRRDGTHLTIEGLPSSLSSDPLPQLNLRLKLTGGRCDGQTFTTRP